MKTFVSVHNITKNNAHFLTDMPGMIYHAVFITFVFPENHEKTMPMTRFPAFVILFIASLLAALPVPAQPVNGVHYRINGLPDGKAYLLCIHGKSYDAVDSVNTVNGVMDFLYSDTLPAGMYRISFDKDLFTDVIINHEIVDLENNMDDLFLNLSVRHSEENRIYYFYWRTSRLINDTIHLIAAMGDKIFEANGHKLTPDLDSMQLKAGYLNRRLNRMTDSLIAISKGMLVQKILRAYRTPDYDTYRRQPGAKPYKRRSEFLREHYFDNIDFADDRLLNTEIYNVICTDYINTYADPPTDSAYISVSDFILSKAQINPAVHEYILRLLISTFEDTPWEQTFIHLIDQAVAENSCSSGPGLKTEKQKAAAIKKLKPGNPAPPLIMNDPSGKPVDLYSVTAKITLLMFWSPDCQHCAEAMPGIADIYTKFKASGFQIYAVSVGSDKTAWQKMIRDNTMEWINVSDLKGPDSDALMDYNAWTTPVFLLLDENKKIIARPFNAEQIMDVLKGKF